MFGLPQFHLLPHDAVQIAFLRIADKHQVCHAYRRQGPEHADSVAADLCQPLCRVW